MAAATGDNPSMRTGFFNRFSFPHITSNNVTSTLSKTYQGFKSFIGVVAPDLVENAIYGWAITYAMSNFDSSYLQHKEFNYKEQSVIDKANYVALGCVILTTVAHVTYNTLIKLNIFNKNSEESKFSYTRAMSIAGSFGYCWGSIQARLTN
ncbi:MAG: hypothetical protein K1060chlam5_01349 [Candidatus Anoxychlamydiales bacterium]|nr:hypothetical protein [Candidatus Anoxychlamydiales bacterium]